MMKMEEHPVALSFINNIIKNSLRNSNLKQIGKNPRFFMPAKATQFQNIVETWPGFFTSSWIFQKGIYLTIDNISKFLSIDNCLNIIYDRLKRYDEYQVSREWEGSIVMAKYGINRTYKVNCIRWDKNPMTETFDTTNDEKISMVNYFLNTYKIKIYQAKQPLFEIKQKRQNIYLPPELCILVGIPPRVRENKKIMADIRQSLFQRPEQRIESIKELNRTLAQSKEVRDWQLELQMDPDEVEAQVLKRPNIVDPTGADPRSLDETSILRSIVHEPVHFNKWAIFCLDKDVENAKYIQEKFYHLSNKNQMNIYVEYGDVVSLRDNASVEDFKTATQSYYKSYVAPAIGTTKDVYFFLIIMPDTIRQEVFYSTLKNKINSDNPVISQFVSAKTIERDNDRIYMNIIRQINAKLGGDLWRMAHDKEISERTMLLGIDVCHKGKSSVIGFVASYDKYMCKYYTQACPQEVKGKEIISSSILTEYYKGAFGAYRDFNDGALPEHIFIYRDGVGDAMRKMVIETELDQLKKLLREIYGTEKQPEITLIIVNKRVRQRFFEIRGHQYLNPPAGTYVDTGFVEQSEMVDGRFDFYLVPHAVTQGSVKPTHFYVAENSSKISKSAILNFTYSLCFGYYNWPDSIKIPAPCMLADKIAIYRSEIGNIPSNIDLHKLPFYL